jgi:hypothetical protein
MGLDDGRVETLEPLATLGVVIVDDFLERRWRATFRLSRR